MSIGVGFSGLNERIDGPPPITPVYGLLQAAQAPAAGVRIVPDVDERGIERWMNGVSVYPYPPDQGDIYDPCASGSPAPTKGFGETLAQPEFGAMTAYIAETCTVFSVPDQEAYKARATAVLMAVESSIIAREFKNGLQMPGNPHLADGNGIFPNGDAVTDFPNAIAYLEAAIAATGRAGLIHCSPELLSSSAARFGWNYWNDPKGQVIRMISGTVIIPDAGYSGGGAPTGHAEPDIGQEWIYATGPIDIRRTEPFVMPPLVAQAVDRGTGGATNGLPNSITYRAERYYMVDWDTELQAAVLVDRCISECGTPGGPS
jgi:hypothetical protein